MSDENEQILCDCCREPIADIRKAANIGCRWMFCEDCVFHMAAEVGKVLARRRSPARPARGALIDG